MKSSTQLSDAVHILAYIEIFKDSHALSSEQIAQSVATNPTNVRKIMAQLRKANLIQTTVGKPNPKLARKASAISLFDIYHAISNEDLLLQIDGKTNINCLVGANIQTALDQAYQQVQQAAELEMRNVSLDMIIQNILQASKN